MIGNDLKSAGERLLATDDFGGSLERPRVNRQQLSTTPKGRLVRYRTLRSTCNRVNELATEQWDQGLESDAGLHWRRGALPCATEPSLSYSSRAASASVGSRPCGVNLSTASGNSRVSLDSNSSRESPVCCDSELRTSGPIACSS